MPIYEYNGKRYNIPEAKAQELITRMPGAKLIDESTTSADKSSREPQSGAQNDIYVPQVNQTTFDSEMVRQAQAKQLGGGVTIGQKQNIADVTGDMYGSRDLTLPEPTNAAQEQDGFWGTMVGDFGEKIGAGVLNLTGGLAKVHENTNPIMLAARKLLGKDGDMVPDAIPQQLLETGKEVSERGDRYGLMVDPETGETRKKTYSDLWKEGKRGAAVGEAMLTATESLPTSAMAMVPGAGLTLIGLSVAGQTYNELDNNPETKDLPEWKKILNASASGAIEGLTERLGAKVDMKVFEPVLKKMGEQTVKGILKKGGIGALIQTITEGGEEVISQLGGNVVDYATGVSDEYKPFEGVKDSFVYGAAGGAQFGGVTGAGTIYRAVEQHKANVETAKVQNTLRLWESINKKQSQALPALNNEKQQLEAELGDLTTLSYEEVLNSPESTPELIQARERYDIVNAEYEGVMENLKREVDDFIAPQVQAIQDVAKDGVITELNVGTEDAPDIVYLVKGDVAINEDGTIYPLLTSPMLIVKNSEGKKRMIARSKIATAQRDDLNTTIEGIKQRAYEQLVRPLADKMEGKTHFQNGEKVEYTNSKGETVAGTVTAKQNNTVTVVGIDGKKTETFTEDELAQRLVGETIDDVRTRDVIQVQMNGQVYDADVTNIQDGIAELHIPSFPEAAGRYQDVTAAELRRMRVMPQAQVQVDSKTTQETAENEGLPAGEIRQNESETAETGAESQITPEQQQEQFIASLPKTKEGDIDYDKIEDDDTFITAIKSEFPEDAAEIVEEYRKQAEKKLKDAGRVQDPIKKKRAQRAAQAQVDRFNGMYERLNPKAQYQARVDGLDNGTIREREGKMGEYLSLRDYLLRNIATGKFKFRWNNDGTNKGLAGEILATKNTESERKIRLPYLDNNGYSPESLAEYIYENAGQGSEINPGWFKDDSDIRNEIIDVLLSYDKPTRMIDAAAELHKQPESLEEYYENFVDPAEIFNYEANEVSQNDMLSSLPTQELHNQISDEEVELYFTGNNSTFDITNTQQYDNQNEGTRAGSDRADAEQFGARTDQGDNSRNDGGREDQTIGDLPFAGEVGGIGERSAQPGIEQPATEGAIEELGRPAERPAEGVNEAIEAEAAKVDVKPTEAQKQQQFDIIQASNPMQDDVHTGIRSADEILTAEEAFSYHITNGEDATPDFTSADMTEALRTGKVTVYSSYPIENGVFVSPSKMEAQNYAGEGKLYSKNVPVTNVAWIDQTQGQYAGVTAKETAKEGRPKGITVVNEIDNGDAIEYGTKSNTTILSIKGYSVADIQEELALERMKLERAERELPQLEETLKMQAIGPDSQATKSAITDNRKIIELTKVTIPWLEKKLREQEVDKSIADVIEKVDNNFASLSDLTPHDEQLWAKKSISRWQANKFLKDIREFQDAAITNGNVEYQEDLDRHNYEMLEGKEIKINTYKLNGYTIEVGYDGGLSTHGASGLYTQVENPQGEVLKIYDPKYRTDRTIDISYRHPRFIKKQSGPKEVDVEGLFGALRTKGEAKLSDHVKPQGKEAKDSIRKLGTGSNVYFDSNGIRVNDYQNGKVLMNVDSREDFGGPAFWNIEFDTPEEAVKIANELAKIYPNGVPQAVLLDRVVKDMQSKGAEVKPKTDYGANNKIITQERYNELREQMRKKLNNLNVGFDPEVFSIGAQMAMFHIESGAHKFADFAKRMVDDLGDAIRPYLKASYEGARAMPGMEELSSRMDPYKDVVAFDVNQSFEETEAPKEPWQMTREEWGEQHWNSLSDNEKFKWSDISLTKDEVQKMNDDVVAPHIEIIQQAISEGKDVPAEVLAGYPELKKDKPKVKRFEQGGKLNEKEKSDVLKTMKDSYKEMNRERSLEAGPDGNERFVWKGNAEDYMAVSDITGRKVRWYVTMPDGKIAHPTELYPNITIEDIKSAENSDNYHLQQSEVNYRNGAKKLAESKKSVIDQLQKALDAGLEFVKTYDSSDVRERNPITMIRTNVRTKENPNGMIIPLQEYMANNDIDIPDLKNFDWERYYNNNTKQGEQNEQGTRSTEAIEAETETIESASDVIRTESENVGSDQQRAGDVKEQADEQVKKVETLLIEVEQKLANLKLSGKNYSTDGIAADYPINVLAKGPIKKDATAYVKAVAAMTGLEHDTDRKGKREILNVNIAPAGGDVTFVLWSKKNPDYGVYVSVPYSPDYRNGYDDYHVERSILWRVTTKQDKWRGLSNQYVNSDVTAQEMAETLLKGLNQELRSRGLEQEINQVEKSPETVKNKRINKKTSAKVAKNQTNMLSLFGEEDDVSPINTNQDAKPRRRNEEANDSLGGKERQEAGRPQSGRVDSGSSQDNGDDREGSRGVSGSSTNSEATQKRNARNNRNERWVNYSPKTPKARFNANLAAIKLMRKLNDGGITVPTPEQMDVLRRYSGWGGLGTFFNDNTPENNTLREVLDDVEYQNAVDSVRSAYYTPPFVIDTLWDIAQRLGFKGGNILESSAGIGSIIGSMPQSISDSSFIEGVEIDSVSGGILKLLYPDANIHVKGFEETNIRNGSVDLAITNVPFVTGLNVFDPVDKDLARKFKNLHDFVIAKNIRKLTEGGIGIFITTKGTLDSSKKLREWIGGNGSTDVIGAFRLNNETFEGTGVTSDIIVVRKRVAGQVYDGAIDVLSTGVARSAEYKTGEAKWVRNKGYVEEVKTVDLIYNQYFIDNPDNMGGEMAFGFEHGDTFRPTSSGLYGKARLNQNLFLENWAKGFKRIVYKKEKKENTQDRAFETTNAKEGQLIIDKNGNIAISKRGIAEDPSINNNKVKGRPKTEVLNDYNTIKTAIDDLLQYQINNQDDKGLKPFLANLNKVYDKFVSKYGQLNNNISISWLRKDVDFPAVAALEKYSETKDIKGKKIVKVEKTSVFRDRVIGFKSEPQPKTIHDAVIASVHEHNGILIPYIAEKLNIDESDARDQILKQKLGFANPETGGIDVRHAYLSGNVREKLRIARDSNADGIYDENIKELEKVIPMDIPTHLIDITIGSTWIPASVFEKFFDETYGVSLKLGMIEGAWVKTDEKGSINEKNRKAGVFSEMFQEHRFGHELAYAAMNNRNIVFSKVVRKGDSSETITDKDATAAASSRISEIKDEFREWVQDHLSKNEELSDQIKETFNNKFNAVVPMKIDVEFIPERFEGSATFIDLYPHQKNSVVRSTMQPLMLAHEVGTGKTFTLISSAMEMRRLGTAKKPMIVVQNATIGQFVAEAKMLYPNAKILALSDNDRNRAGRLAFYANIKYNDWDIVVIPQSTFDMIPDSPERQQTFIQEKIDEKIRVIEAMSESDVDSRIINQAKNQLEDLYAELAGRDDEKENKGKKGKKKDSSIALDNAAVRAKQQLDRRTDDVQYFDDLGVDALLIDEAHAYKKLGYETTMARGVKGIDTSRSKRAAGLYIKTRAILEKSGGKNVVFATGTPITNTAAEIWTFMRYLLPKDVLIENDMLYFDDFAKNFGSIDQVLEFATSGKFKENTRFARYLNLAELVRIWASVSDTVLTKDIGYVNDKVPKMETGDAQDIYLEQSDALVDIMTAVRAKLEEFDNMTGKEKRENNSIPIVMYGIAKRAAIDARLIDKDAPDDPISKTNKTVEEVLRSLNETKAYKGTVAIFCDKQNRKDDGVITFNIFDDIKQKLINKGIPEEQIAIMKSGMNIKKKQKIFADVNEGNIRVILGSTSTLGTGVNIQERLHTLIHMDAPDLPMEYTQRTGRILRQGNLHREWGKEVRVIRFGVVDSLDVTSYQMLNTKSNIINSVMDSKTIMADAIGHRNIEEENNDLFGNTVAQLSGSQYALLKIHAEKELRKLKSKKKQHEADQIYVENNIKRNELWINLDQKELDRRAERLEMTKKLFPDGKTNEMVLAGEKVKTDTELESIIKEKINKPLNEIIETERKNASFKAKTYDYPFKLNGIDFTIHFILSRNAEYDESHKGIKITMSRKIRYSSPTFGLKDVPVSGSYVNGAIRDILDNVITGKDDAEWIEYAEKRIVERKEDNAFMAQRRGKKFDQNDELAEAEAKVEEYALLMKQELEEKEKKYRERGTGKKVDVDAIESEDEEVLNDDDEDLRFRSLDEAGFYSTVEDALEKIKQEKGTPEQFKAMLLKNGAKQAELDYMGWDDYFVGNRKLDPNLTLYDVNIKGTITKTDIQDWIDQNRIEVQEVEKSDSKTNLFDENYKNAVYEHAKSQLEKADRLSLPDYQKILNDWMDRPTNELNVKIENILWREGLISYPGFRNNNGYSTKFAQYTLPGGKNYRELLLLLTMLTNHKSYSLIDVKTNKVLQTSNDYEELVDRRNELGGELVVLENNESKGVTFKSGHFDEPNILAHVRFVERTVNGERVLFLEEIQSDWAQEGKKKGFKGDYKNKSLVEPRFDGKYWYLHEKGSGEMTSSQSFRTEAEAWKQIEGTMRLMDNGVPNMPFKKTDQWVNLALRRMMMYAAENGYDRIAWTTGQQQADRYDLSKQVDEVYYNPNTKEFGYFIKADPSPKVYPKTEPKDIENYVGKEVARKLLETPINSEDLQSIKGDGLKVGGEGMKAFYDNIVPKAAKKLAKPFGAEVETIQMHLNNVDVKPDSLPKEVQDLIDNYYTGEVEMDELSSELDKLGYEYSFGMDGDIENVYKKGGDSYSFQSIPITDELREIAPGGMPLFRTSKEKANEAYALREWKRAENAVNRLAKKMGVEVELLETTEGLPKKKATSHGWYDVKAKKITIVMPNHRNSMDVQATFLHEAVGHHGLRELFGKHFNTFLDNVYNNAEEGIRDRIDMIAEQGNFNTRKATEEYLSQLAEDPRITETEKVGGIASFFRNVRRFFFEMLAKAGFNPGFRLSNNELKYILWRSYNNLAEPGRYRSIVDHAKDVAMQDRLKVGNYAERGTRADVAEEPGKGESPMFHSGEKMSELDEILKTATKQGVKTETVRQIIDEIESVHTSEIEATVVNNKQELIDLLRMMNANEEMVAEAEDPDVPLKGVYFRGMIFINAGEMNSVNDVLKVWVHENFHAWMKKDPSKIVPLMGVFSEETLNNNLYKGYHKQSEAVKIEEILAFAIEKVYVGGPLTKKREIRDHLDPIIKQYLDYATEGEFSKRNPDFGRGRGRNAYALLDNEGSGREGVAAARNGGSPYQQRQANEAILPGDERVPGEEVKRADDLFDNIDNLKSVVKDYGGFLGKVFEGAPNRGDMLAYARENGFDKLGEGIEQYLADVEDPAELSRIKELLGVDMPDNALRYMLWRNANPNENTVVWKAKEAVKRNELDENILFSKGEVPSSIKNDKYEQRIRSRHNRGFRSLMYGIEEGWFDRMASLRILQNAITGGKAVSDKANAYMLENQLTSRNTADIRYYTKNLVDPFVKQIHDIFGRNMNAADEYMNAKHGLERNDLMAEEEAKRKYAKSIASLNKEYADEKIDEDTYNEKMEAINGKIEAYAEKLKEEKDYSGLTAIAAERGREDFKAVAQEIVAEIEGGVPKEDIDALWSRVNSATKWILDKQYNAGIMTKDIYDKIRSMYKYYVPLRGFEEVTATDLYEYIDNSPSNFEGTVKKAYGRTSKAESPTATIMSMGESGIMQANRNRMKQAFYRLVATNPSNYASIEDVWFVETADGFEERFPDISPTASADEVLEAIADFNNDMAELAAEGKAFQGRNKLDIGVKIMKAQASEHVIRVWIAGEEKVIFINGNPRAAQAINGLVQKDLLSKDNLRHGVHYWSRQMAANFTSRNPAFMVTNLMRDVQFAVVSAAVKEGIPYSSRLAKNVFLVGKTISANVFKDGNKDNAEFQKYWEEFEANGGETGYANLHSIDFNRKYVNKKLREFSDQRDFLKPFRAYVQFMENGNRTIEDMSRFATYVTSRQMGRSIERSVSDAKEITINFNRKGSGGFGANLIHSFYLFSNPALQSMRLMGMLAKNHPVKFTAMLSSAMGAGFMVPMINELLLGLFGDDDDKEKYQNITPWVRRNNLVLYVPGTKGKFITLMLPHELRAFYGIGEMAYEKANGGLRRENMAVETAKQMTAMLPIDPMGGPDWWVPDALKPPYQAYVTNRNFMGSPIYRDTPWNKLDPEWTKAYRGTPELLVEAAKGASDITGGDDVVPGWANANPARAYHLFSGYLGGFMTTYTDMSMIAFNLLTGRDVRANDVPVVNKLIRTSDEKTEELRINSEYFYYIDWIREYEHRAKGYEKRVQDPEYRDKYMDVMRDKEQRMYNFAKGQIALIDQLKDYDEEKANEMKEQFVRKMWEYEDQD